MWSEFSLMEIDIRQYVTTHLFVFDVVDAGMTIMEGTES